MIRALLLYDSVDENVKKVAMAISRGLESGDMIVDSFSIDKINVDKLNDYDVIGIGGYTCSNGISMQMKELLRSIELIKMKGKIGFAFEAKSDFKPVSSAARIIYDHFKQIKVKLIHPPIAGMLIGVNGSLLKKRLVEMEQIGLEISEKVNKAFKTIQKDLEA